MYADDVTKRISPSKFKSMMKVKMEQAIKNKQIWDEVEDQK